MYTDTLCRRRRRHNQPSAIGSQIITKRVFEINMYNIYVSGRIKL